MTEGPRRSGGDRWWVGFLVTVCIAGALTLAAYAEKLPPILAHEDVDKGVHFFVAGLLAFFLDGALARRNVRIAGAGVSLAALVVLVPTAIEELLQRYSPVRESSVWDFAADITGVVLFTWLSRRVGRPVR